MYIYTYIYAESTTNSFRHTYVRIFDMIHILTHHYQHTTIPVRMHPKPSELGS